MNRPNTLVINRSDSICGGCERSADPMEAAHDTVFGWGPHGPGCGERYLYVDTDYMGIPELIIAIKEMRPDLEPVGMVANPMIPPVAA